MERKAAKQIARVYACAVKVSDLSMELEKTNEELRAILDVRSKAMEAIFKLGFDLDMKYKVINKKG